MSATWESLSGALSGVPSLPGARCVGRWSIFDETDCPETIEYAVNQCRGCPALEPCRDYVESLKPSKRPPGVVAGRVVRQHGKAA